MKKILHYLVFVFFVLSCSRNELVPEQKPDLLFVVKSKNNTLYSGFMNYPQYYNLYSSLMSERNKYPSYFSVNYDSAEFTFKNSINRKEIYLSIKYLPIFNENDCSSSQFLKFENIEILKCSADSFKLIDKELWLYCD